MLKKRNIILFSFTLVLSSLNLQALEPDPYPQSRELFYHYSGTAELEESLNQEKQLIPLDRSEAYMLLCTSEYDLLVGISYLRENDRKMAKEYLQRSLEGALAASELEETVNTYQQLTQTIIYYGLAQGVGGIISSAREAASNIDKLLELDPFHPEGLILKSQKMIFAPRGFGGDPLQAVKILEFNLRRLESLSRSQQFETILGLSQAHARLGDMEKALEYALLAEQYYPRNKDLQDWMQELNRKI